MKFQQGVESNPNIYIFFNIYFFSFFYSQKKHAPFLLESLPQKSLFLKKDNRSKVYPKLTRVHGVLG